MEGTINNFENNYSKTETTNAQTEGRVEIADNKPENGADFETAILETKFGLFNCLLILIALPGTLTLQFETTSMSYVLPAAQCDLDLTLGNKGLLNAITFSGMMISGLFAGFVVDAFGRRKILAIGYYLDSLFQLVTTFAPNFYVILVGKFLGGFIVTAPATALTTYLSEFHGKKYRSRVPLILGLLFNIDNILLALMAWSVLPLDIHLNWFGGVMEFHAWNALLLISTLPGLIGGTIFTLFMPESPKYLMTKGHNGKALNIFQNIYKINTLRSKKSYPIDRLRDEINSVIPTEENRKSNTVLSRLGKQIGEVFHKPHLSRLLLVSLLQLFLILSSNTLRLWLPQIFQVINDYQASNNSGSGDFCSILDTIHVSSKDNDVQGCNVNLDNSQVYMNAIIVAVVSFCGYLVAAIIINMTGKKKIMFSSGIVAGLSGMALFVAPNSITALALICVYIMCSVICIDVLIAVVIDLFPTNLRASALSMTLVCGRFGSMLGNILFPLLLQAGCGPPFFTLGSIMIGCAFFSLILPNTDLKSLE